MQLVAVHDTEGKIIAATIVGYDDETPAVIPQAGEGTYAIEIELDDELAQVPLEQLCTTMRVDAKSRRLVERAAD